MDGTTDERPLLKALRKGSYVHFSQLFDNHRKGVFNFLVTIGASYDEADEGLQEVFTRLWNKRETVRTDLRLRPFLLAIARNWFINQRKKGNPVKLTGEFDSNIPGKTDDPAASAEKREMEHNLREAVANLPEELREPFVMSRLQGLTYKEIGQILGISPRTVEDRMKNAFDKLKVKLSHLMDNG